MNCWKRCIRNCPSRRRNAYDMIYREMRSDELRNRGYKKISLAVQKANHAVKMYEAAGFKMVDENEEEYIMVCELA